jgi:hypothetical protein
VFESRTTPSDYSGLPHGDLTTQLQHRLTRREHLEADDHVRPLGVQHGKCLQLPAVMVISS